MAVAVAVTVILVLSRTSTLNVRAALVSSATDLPQRRPPLLLPVPTSLCDRTHKLEYDLDCPCVPVRGGLHGFLRSHRVTRCLPSFGLTLLQAALSVQNILQFREVGGHAAHLTRKSLSCQLGWRTWTSEPGSKTTSEPLLPSPPFGRSLACLLHGQLRPRQQTHYPATPQAPATAIRHVRALYMAGSLYEQFSFFLEKGQLW